MEKETGGSLLKKGSPLPWESFNRYVYTSSVSFAASLPLGLLNRRTAALRLHCLFRKLPPPRFLRHWRREASELKGKPFFVSPSQ
jgi:hypothetical protein